MQSPKEYSMGNMNPGNEPTTTKFRDELLSDRSKRATEILEDPFRIFFTGWLPSFREFMPPYKQDIAASLFVCMSVLSICPSLYLSFVHFYLALFRRCVYLCIIVWFLVYFTLL